MPSTPTFTVVKLEEDADSGNGGPATPLSQNAGALSRRPSILDMMHQHVDRAHRPRDAEEPLPSHPPAPPQPTPAAPAAPVVRPTAPATPASVPRGKAVAPASGVGKRIPTPMRPRVAATVSAGNAFIVGPDFSLGLSGGDVLSDAEGPPEPQAAAATGIEPSASQVAIAAAAARDDPREVPMEWSLPGGPAKWGFLLPWLPLAALLQMWDAVAEAPPPPDMLFTLHGLLGRCAGCFLWGQTKPTLMTHGAHLYYSDSAAQCPACSRTKFVRGGTVERVDTRVWHEISTAELEGAYGRHTFAAVLYPTTSPQTIESVLRATPVRELRLTCSALVSQLNRIAASNYLQVLHLSGCGLRDANLLALRSCAPQLRTLNLSNNLLTTLNAIAPRLYELRSLDVSQNPFEATPHPNRFDWLSVTLPQIGKLRRFVCKEAAYHKLVAALANLRCVEEVVLSTPSYGQSVDASVLILLKNLKILMTCSNCRWKPANFPNLRAFSVGVGLNDFADAETCRMIRPAQLPFVLQMADDPEDTMHADSRDLSRLQQLLLDVEMGRYPNSGYLGLGEGFDEDEDEEDEGFGWRPPSRREAMDEIQAMAALFAARMQARGERYRDEEE